MSQSSNDLPREIENALTYLNDKDVATFRRKFRSQADDSRQRDHTAVELAAGVYCARLGYALLYERTLGGLTPDWQVHDCHGEPAFFADVLTFHMAQQVEREQERQLEEQGIFCGFVPSSEDRLYGILQKKTTSYKVLADDTGQPFVVFVFGCFNAMLTSQEISRCLHGEQGLFGLYLHLSGVYHFESITTLAHGQVYDFKFHANEGATRPLELPSGFVPRPMPARAAEDGAGGLR